MEMKFPSITKLTCLMMFISAPVQSAGWRIAQNKVEAPAHSSETSHVSSIGDTRALEDHELGQDVGGGVFYPIVNVSAGYRGKAFEENENGVRSGVDGGAYIGWRIGGGYQSENRGHLGGVEYLVEGNEFVSGDNKEDEISQRLTGYWGTAFTPRNHLDVGVEFLDTYDPRGEENSLRNIRHNTRGQEVDRRKEKRAGAIYSFGSDRSRGRVELSGFYGVKEYDNNQQQYRDRDELDLNASVFVKLAPKTEAFAQIVYTDIDYVDQALTDPSGGRSLDNEETRYMLGIQWKPSKKLSGTIRAGVVEKSFVAGSGRSDYDEASWDSTLLWRPNFRDSFGLAYSRSPRETYVYSESQLLDDFIEVEQLDLNWTHLWGKKFSTSLSYYVGDDKYVPSGRSDDREGYSVGLSYALPRWGTIGAQYIHRELTSDIPDHDYDEDSVFLFFNLGVGLGLGEGNTRAPGIRSQRSFQPGYSIY